MKVTVPVMVQDGFISPRKGADITEHFVIEREAFFLDGPIAKRVAVLDFDPVTGALRPGVKFHPPSNGDPGWYEIADPSDFTAPDFNQVSVFGTVLKTMDMFEDLDTLGRPLRWAFEAPQLLVVPRAGQWANAYYERESQSLQFFYFDANDRTVYTSLSTDIVAHETGHAILDGISPDLYNAITPQSLALHEAVADLTALLIAFRSRELVETVLGQTGGSIAELTAFSSIAEEFGRALDPDGKSYFLRSLSNDKSLNPGVGTLIPRDEPHDLSEVLSGALFSVMVRMHGQRRQEIAQAEGTSEFSASGKALFVASEHFKRMILRALDYLPPGEVSFADYARAILASDQASHPDDERERDWLVEAFIQRGIVPDRAALEVRRPFEHPAVANLDLPTLVDSDWAAYEFANNQRELLGIPQGIHFRVRPRLHVTKRYRRPGGKTEDVSECIFKVSWDHKEGNPIGSGFPGQRQITVGTTLAIDWRSRTVRSLLIGEASQAAADDNQQADDRTAMLAKLLRQGILVPEELAVTPDGAPLPTAIRAEMLGDELMRVRGTARMLHITEEGIHGHA